MDEHMHFVNISLKTSQYIYKKIVKGNIIGKQHVIFEYMLSISGG